MTPGDVPGRPPGPGWPARPTSGRRRIRQVAIGTGLVSYSWVAGSSAPFSTRALLGVLFPGALIGAVACGRSADRVPAPDRIDIAGFSYWVIAIAALLEWEASAVRLGTIWSHPSLTALVNPLIAPHLVKSAAILVWLLAGWGLVKR